MARTGTSKKEYLVAVQRSRSEYTPFVDRWAYYLERAGCRLRWVNLMAADALDQVRECHGVMWCFPHASVQKDVAWRVLTTIERYLGIPVFPNWYTAWHYDEKNAQYYLFEAHDIPTPDTWLFWEKDEALEWASNATYPVVYKMSHGSGSSNVCLVRDESEAERLIRLAFGPGVMYGDVELLRNGGGRMRGLWIRTRRWASRVMRATADAVDWRLDSPLGRPFHGARKYVYFQEFVPGNEFDVRVVVIGERAFAFRRFTREGDWRASGSGRLDHDQSQIDRRCIQLGFDVAHRLRLQSCGLDVIFKAGDPVVTEISYTFAMGSAGCPGYFTPNGEWVQHQMEPWEAHIEDFLEPVREYAEAVQRKG